MDSKIVYEILNSALSGQKYCVIKTLNEYYCFNFTSGRIESIENIILIDNEKSMTYIDCHSIISIQVSK